MYFFTSLPFCSKFNFISKENILPSYPLGSHGSRMWLFTLSFEWTGIFLEGIFRIPNLPYSRSEYPAAFINTVNIIYYKSVKYIYISRYTATLRPFFSKKNFIKVLSEKINLKYDGSAIHVYVSVKSFIKQ